jgi:hypothetical protein
MDVRGSAIGSLYYSPLQYMYIVLYIRAPTFPLIILHMPYYTKPLIRTSSPTPFYLSIFYLPLHIFIAFPPIYYIPLFLLLYFVNAFANITICTSQQPSSHYIMFLHFLPYLDILEFLPQLRHLVYSQYITSLYSSYYLFPFIPSVLPAF